MKTLNYTIAPGTNITDGIERAISIARAVNKPIIVIMNYARFGVNPNTTVQDAIKAYMEVKDAMFQTEKLLKQNEIQRQ